MRGQHSMHARCMISRNHLDGACSNTQIISGLYNSIRMAESGLADTISIKPSQVSFWACGYTLEGADAIPGAQHRYR